MPPQHPSFSSRLSVAFCAAPTSDGGAPSAEDPGAGGGVRRLSFSHLQGGATPKGSPSEVELGSTPTKGPRRPGMPMRQQSLNSLVSQTVEEDEEEVHEAPAVDLEEEVALELEGFPEMGSFWRSLNPMEPWRINWDIGMLFMILFVMLVTPFELTFVSGDRPFTDANMGLFVINRCVDTVFVVDLGLNFVTSYFDVDHGRRATGAGHGAMSTRAIVPENGSTREIIARPKVTIPPQSWVTPPGG